MKIKLWASTMYVGSKAEHEIEVDDEEWNNSNEFEKEQLMVEMLWHSGLIDWGYEEIE